MVNKLGEELGKLTVLKLSVSGAPKIFKFAFASIFLLDDDYSELDLLLFRDAYSLLFLTGVKVPFAKCSSFCLFYLLWLYKYSASEIFCLLIISEVPDSNIEFKSTKLAYDPISVFNDSRLVAFFSSSIWFAITCSTLAVERFCQLQRYLRIAQILTSIPFFRYFRLTPCDFDLPNIHLLLNFIINLTDRNLDPSHKYSPYRRSVYWRTIRNSRFLSKQYDKLKNDNMNIIMQADYSSKTKEKHKLPSRFVKHPTDRPMFNEDKPKLNQRQSNSQKYRMDDSNIKPIMELKINSKQSSFYFEQEDDYKAARDQVPMLLDLSIDSENADKFDDFGTHNNRERNPRHINSIYIEENEEEQIQKTNYNNISAHDTQVPDHQTLELVSNIQNINYEPNHTHKYGNQMSIIAFDAYCQTFESGKSTAYQAQKNKRPEQILGSILSNQSKIQKYIHVLTEDAIRIKQKQYKSTDMISYLEEMKRRKKDIEVTKILSCLLAKIAETSAMGHAPEVTISKGGQVSINFAALEPKKLQRGVEGLRKFQRTKAENSKLVTPENNDEKISQLIKKMDEQDKRIQSLRKQYEEIINNYAIAIHNLMSSKQQSKVRQSLTRPMKKVESPSKIIREVDELEELIKNSNQIHPKAILNRLSQESKVKSRLKFEDDEEF